VNVIELLSRLVAFPSLSHQEREIADFVEEMIREAALPVTRIDDNVVCHLGDGPRRLLLNSHLDVVPASADHPYPPFEPTIADGRLFGRGSVDAKASVAAMVAALLELAAGGYNPAGGSVWVALTACEETGGGYNGLQATRPHLLPMEAAIVGEPTDLRPCVAQKGLLILEAEARGRTAHAGRPHLGDNAIERAAGDIRCLAGHTFERSDPYLGAPTATVTLIEAGTARNVIPDRCRFTIDVRSVPAYTHQELADEIASLLESDVSICSDRLIPTSTPVDAAIVRACQVALPDAEPFGSPTTSDWVFLNDLPVVKLGPGSSSLSHTAAESISIDELNRAVAAYRDIITAYFAVPAV